ncbi:hypothetical protein CEXT_568421 [Caerostris extrusa]|uniref:Uncharacterized protein n=1 Tax=Caerostris extrusa TaxID=172846 RepID=A0AAV4Q064_CAEEX|nr:hypothetical protein CEXT_568421 [Caerostris extrusa]
MNQRYEVKSPSLSTPQTMSSTQLFHGTVSSINSSLSEGHHYPAGRVTKEGNDHDEVFTMFNYLLPDNVPLPSPFWGIPDSKSTPSPPAPSRDGRG